MSKKQWLGLLFSLGLAGCSGGSTGGPAAGTGGSATGGGGATGSGGVTAGSGGIATGDGGHVAGGSGPGGSGVGGMAGTGGAILPADCRQAACPAGYYCNLGNGSCEVGCGTDPDCASAPNQACDIATHRCQCKTGFHTCGGSCVSSSSPSSCGTSCNACPTDPAGTATCDGTACGLTCNTGSIKCGGVCVACADAHGTASCSATNTCSLRCQSGYNLCGDRCAAATDPTACGTSCTVCPARANEVAMCQQGTCATACAAGATVCKGRCATGTCTWTAHPLNGSSYSHGLDVDASDIVHAATVYNGAVSYYRVSGAGALVPEAVTASGCSGSSNYGEPLLVTADGSGKARIICPHSNTFMAWAWNGSSWGMSTIYSSAGGSGSSGAIGTLDRIAFGWNGSNPTFSLQYAELANGRWTVRQVAADVSGAAALSGVPGATRLAWILAYEQTTLDLATQAGTTFGTPQVLTRMGDSFAFDPSGNIVGVDRNLVLHTYRSGAWVNETITTATTLGVDLAIDASGTPHVAWSDSAGAHLATRINGTWSLERIATTPNTGIQVVVGPTGKVAIATAVAPSPFAVYE